MIRCLKTSSWNCNCNCHFQIDKTFTIVLYLIELTTTIWAIDDLKFLFIFQTYVFNTIHKIKAAIQVSCKELKSTVSCSIYYIYKLCDAIKQCI